MKFDNCNSSSLYFPMNMFMNAEISYQTWHLQWIMYFFIRYSTIWTRYKFKNRSLVIKCYHQDNMYTVSLVNIQFTLQNSHGNVTNNETNSSLISYFTDFHGINCFHVHRLHWNRILLLWRPWKLHMWDFSWYSNDSKPLSSKKIYEKFMDKRSSYKCMLCVFVWQFKIHSQRRTKG